MPKSEAGPLLRFIRAFRVGGAAPEDAVLLERYARARDDAAFELLMWRHAAMVLRVCQDVLQDPFEAEDAFQAAFLVLARKAGSISKRASVSGWLYRVALRIALKARRKKVLRDARERGGMDSLAEHASSTPSEADIPFEWRPVLHEEIGRLPAKYQSPMVLCYLQGRTHEQAALELGWAKGTVAGRLARARDLLRRRLTRRGLALSAGLGLTFLASTASAAVPAALAQSTCKAALAFAAGNTAGLSPQVALWAEGAVRTMLLTKIKSVVITLIVLASVTTGAGAVVYGLTGWDNQDRSRNPPAAPTGDPAPARDPAKPADAPPTNQKKSRNILLVSQQEGVVMLVGTEVKKGENVPPERLIPARGKGQPAFKLLREGDQVKTGQLLVKLDDRLASNRLRVAKAKLAVAKAEYDGAYKTFEEAKARFETAERLYKRNPPLISEEEYREKKLGRDKFLIETEAKKAAIEVADLEIGNAQIILEMHEVRSPVNGTIRTILKRPGEGVKALDPVVEIAPQSR
jgi:RNA polymerase sigma factor (sigma-70 family)